MHSWVGKLSDVGWPIHVCVRQNPHETPDAMGAAREMMRYDVEADKANHKRLATEWPHKGR